MTSSIFASFYSELILKLEIYFKDKDIEDPCPLFVLLQSIINILKWNRIIIFHDSYFISLNMNNILESNRPSALITYITDFRIFFWATYLMKILCIYNRAIPMKGLLFLNRINLSKDFCCLTKRHCQNESATFAPPPPLGHLLSPDICPPDNCTPTIIFAPPTFAL